MENPKEPQEKMENEQLSLSKEERKEIINAVRGEVKQEVSAVIKKDIKVDLIKWCVRWWVIMMNRGQLPIYSELS